MTEQIFCARNCAWQPTMLGEPERPKLATHGTLCEDCFLRVRLALRAIPELLMNMRAAVTPGGNFELTERVQGGGDGSPAPLRIDPLDASNELYTKVCTWVEAFSEEFNFRRPSLQAWIVNNEIQGLPAVSPSHAHFLGKQTVYWLLVWGEQIASSPSAVAFHDDIVYGWEDQPGVHKLMARWGSEPPKPRPSDKRECPICGKCEVFVALPSSFNPEVMVLCGLCSHLIDVTAHLKKYPELKEMLRTA